MNDKKSWQRKFKSLIAVSPQSQSTHPDHTLKGEVILHTIYFCTVRLSTHINDDVIIQHKHAPNPNHKSGAKFRAQNPNPPTTHATFSKRRRVENDLILNLF